MFHLRLTLAPVPALMLIWIGTGSSWKSTYTETYRLCFSSCHSYSYTVCQLMPLMWKRSVDGVLFSFGKGLLPKQVTETWRNTESHKHRIPHDLIIVVGHEAQCTLPFLGPLSPHLHSIFLLYQFSPSLHQTHWSRSNALDFCSRGAGFKSPPNQRLSWLRDFVVFLSPCR